MTMIVHMCGEVGMGRAVLPERWNPVKLFLRGKAETGRVCWTEVVNWPEGRVRMCPKCLSYSCCNTITFLRCSSTSIHLTRRVILPWIQSFYYHFYRWRTLHIREAKSFAPTHRLWRAGPWFWRCSVQHRGIHLYCLIMAEQSSKTD